MPSYLVKASVVSASGTQSYKVEADSPEQAMEKVQSGEGKFFDEEIEVESLEFNVEDVELNE